MQNEADRLIEDVRRLLEPCLIDMSDSVDTACEALSQVENQLYDIEDIIFKEGTGNLSSHEIDDFISLTDVLAKSYAYIDSIEQFVDVAEKKVKALKSLQKAQNGGFKGRLINKNAAITQLQQIDLDSQLIYVSNALNAMKKNVDDTS